MFNKKPIPKNNIKKRTIDIMSDGIVSGIKSLLHRSNKFLKIDVSIYVYLHSTFFILKRKYYLQVKLYSVISYSLVRLALQSTDLFLLKSNNLLDKSLKLTRTINKMIDPFSIFFNKLLTYYKYLCKFIE